MSISPREHGARPRGSQGLGVRVGFTVGSGDQVAAIVARELRATDLVFATDVAEVYESDPETNPDAKLIEQLSLSNLDAIAWQSGAKADASGAMKGKLSALTGLTPELKSGLKMSII